MQFVFQMMLFCIKSTISYACAKWWTFTSVSIVFFWYNMHSYWWHFEYIYYLIYKKKAAFEESDQSNFSVSQNLKRTMSGRNANDRDVGDITPQMVALLCGHSEAAVYLLDEAGADASLWWTQIVITASCLLQRVAMTKSSSIYWTDVLNWWRRQGMMDGQLWCGLSGTTIFIVWKSCSIKVWSDWSNQAPSQESVYSGKLCCGY